jgi:hypothetical protein
MWYITHEFAHTETLDRARRWLRLLGFDPARIEAHSHGVPRLAVAVDHGEAAEVALLIDIAESTDPDGFPSISQPAQPRHVKAQPDMMGDSMQRAAKPASFAVGWHPLEAAGDLGQASSRLER